MTVVGGNSFPLRYRYSEGLIRGYKYCFVPEQVTTNAPRDWNPTAKHSFEVYRWCEDQFGERGERWGEINGGSSNDYTKILVMVDPSDATAFRMRWC